MKVLIFLLFGLMVLAETPNHKTNTLTFVAFGDATHERDLLFIYTVKNGLTLLQQNRISPDNAIAAGSVAAGWKFRVGKGFTQTTIAGPAFGYKPKTGYDGRIILYSISNWRTKYFRLNNSVKLSLPTRETSAFGGRYMQTINGPQNLPKPLQGIALGLESVRTNPNGGRWLEFRVGPSLNLGETVGKEGFWSRITVFPYRDFCRPQPGKPQVWDIRVQYVQTFGLDK